MLERKWKSAKCMTKGTKKGTRKSARKSSIHSLKNWIKSLHVNQTKNLPKGKSER